MDRKYKGWSTQERQREYARLKQEWTESHGYNEKAYNAFIDRITKALGI
jgi:hypothetical protein